MISYTIFVVKVDCGGKQTVKKGCYEEEYYRKQGYDI